MRDNNDFVQFQRALDGSYEPIIIQSEQPGQPKQVEHQNTSKTESYSESVPLKRTRRSLYSVNKGRPHGNRKVKKVKLTLKSL